MAGVAQLVRAPVCGTGGRRFETGHSPHLIPAYAGFVNSDGRRVVSPQGLGGRREIAGVAELVDALVLGTSGESRGGSSPSARTSTCRQL